MHYRKKKEEEVCCASCVLCVVDMMDRKEPAAAKMVSASFSCTIPTKFQRAAKVCVYIEKRQGQQTKENQSRDDPTQ